jgi:LPXTG-motif cell wall-anchored protein
MIDLQTNLLMALAGLNLLALLLVLVSGRRREREPAAAGPVAEPERPPAPAAEEDPFESLVRQAEHDEATLAGSVRAEQRLARNIARWRARAADGEGLPHPDNSCRPEERRRRRESVA